MGVLLIICGTILFMVVNVLGVTWASQVLGRHKQKNDKRTFAYQQFFCDLVNFLYQQTLSQSSQTIVLIN